MVSPALISALSIENVYSALLIESAESKNPLIKHNEINLYNFVIFNFYFLIHLCELHVLY